MSCFLECRHHTLVSPFALSTTGSMLIHTDYTANMTADEQQPSWDDEIAKFKTLYVNDSRPYASELDKAVAAYQDCRTWLIMQRMDNQVLQDTQEKISELKVGQQPIPSPGLETLGEGRSPIPFPKEMPFLAIHGGRRVASLPDQTH